MNDDKRKELRDYIEHCLDAGLELARIEKILTDVGWARDHLHEVFGEVLHKRHTSKKRVGSDKSLLYAASAIFVLLVLGFATFHIQDIERAPDASALSRGDTSHASSIHEEIEDNFESIYPSEEEFLSTKNKYIEEKKSFIEADLQNMTLALYRDGGEIETLPIKTKGERDSWWETPTGNYEILGKERNHFSSIGEVWMPYSMRFYGNYYVHGWPYYDDGTPVPQSYSGGCIRLSTEDAKKVFEFADLEMPLLVLEDEENHHFGVLKEKDSTIVAPNLSSKAFLIADLSTGKTLLEKNSDQKRPIASLTKLMTAVVSHEMMYLGRKFSVSPDTVASVHRAFKASQGARYTGFDLLYPLLMQSSNETANVLASGIGQEYFNTAMNVKARSLEMENTTFSDPSGLSDGNISTAQDISKLLHYIYYKRKFIFDISKGKTFSNVGIIRIGDTIDIDELLNYNELYDKSGLIGIKNGETTAAGQTMASVWNIETPTGGVPVGIIVLGSEDRASDTTVLLSWVKEHFETR